MRAKKLLFSCFMMKLHNLSFAYINPQPRAIQTRVRPRQEPTQGLSVKLEGEKNGDDASSHSLRSMRYIFTGFPWQRLPNWLTYTRCLATVTLPWLFYTPRCRVMTAVVFMAASFTDWLDGYLARRLKISSDFGAFLDPVADKLMVSTALILLSGEYGPVVVIPTAIILAREIAVSALREWMAHRELRDTVKVGFQGKLKTALTMISLSLLLMSATTTNSAMGTLFAGCYLPGIVSLYLCTVITVTSGSAYFIAASSVLLKN